MSFRRWIWSYVGKKIVCSVGKHMLIHQRLRHSVFLRTTHSELIPTIGVFVRMKERSITPRGLDRANRCSSTMVLPQSVNRGRGLQDQRHWEAAETQSRTFTGADCRAALRGLAATSAPVSCHNLQGTTWKRHRDEIASRQAGLNDEGGRTWVRLSAKVLSGRGDPSVRRSKNSSLVRSPGIHRYELRDDDRVESRSDGSI